MAQNGQRTLLVGANLRRPSIHRFFGIEREPGLSDVLVGNANWRDCIRTIADVIVGRFEMEDIMAAPGLDNLHILESGAIPANPSELLSTPAMARFLREVREAYDVVLIDTPPVLPVTDSAIVGAQVDGVILVYQAGKIGRLVLKRAKAHLESTRASVWGVVLNDVQSEIAGYTYAHYYTHYYGEEPGARPPARRFGRVLGLFRRRRGRPAVVDAGSIDHVDETPAPLAHDDRPARAAVVEPGALDEGDDDTEARPRRRRRRLTGIAGDVGVVLLLVIGVLGAVAWRMGWFSGERAWRGVDRRAKEAVTAPAPAVPASPEAAAPSSVAPPSAPDTTSASVADAPARRPATPETPPREEAAKEPAREPAKETAPVAAAPRFAVELGPFLTNDEAEKAERQLNEAGYQTVRFRQPKGTALYAVLIERVPGTREAQAITATLKEQGFPASVGVSAKDGMALRVGEPMLLRSAVSLAENLRGKGHQVRVSALPGDAQTFVIRHGNFASRQDAEATGAELQQRGLANHVVRAK
jgi:cell division septation protein DedD